MILAGSFFIFLPINILKPVVSNSKVNYKRPVPGV